MKIDEFYEECGKILGVSTEYKEQKLYNKFDRETGQKYKVPTRGNRWGGREPGNGRFPKRGLIRVFGNSIHIALHTPKLNGLYNSFDEALIALNEAVAIDQPKAIGQFIDVTISGGLSRGLIIGEYDENQWIVEIEIKYSNGYKDLLKRYIDKDVDG